MTADREPSLIESAGIPVYLWLTAILLVGCALLAGSLL